jgi:hypothetical protein
MAHLVGNVFPQISILPQFVGRKSIYDISGLVHEFGKLGVIKEIPASMWIATYPA